MTEQLKEKVVLIRAKIDDDLEKLPFSSPVSGFFKPIRYTLSSRGKRFRPILVHLVGESLGAEYSDLAEAALSIEILHAFTLVHDDIMDNDISRRGQPTIHVKWDVNTAILAGDGLISLAFETLMRSKAPDVVTMGKKFASDMLEICEGQALDIEFEHRTDVSTDDYLTMVKKKTGVLIELACQFGALAAGADTKLVDQLGTFGLKIGQAFQIQDDLLEITSDEKKMGKSLGSDIVRGKKTFPIVLAMSEMDDREKKNFIHFLKRNANHIVKVSDKLRSMGVVQKTEMYIDSLFEESLSLLDEMPVLTRDYLLSFGSIIQKRQF